jgi:hypothetical protein
MSEAFIEMDFDGPTYEPEHDKPRLNAQCQRVWDLMEDGKWRTLREIGDTTHDPESSISARLRDFRKLKFGAYQVERRRRGQERRGLFEYRLIT